MPRALEPQEQGVQQVWLNRSDVGDKLCAATCKNSPMPTKSGHRAASSPKLIFE